MAFARLADGRLVARGTAAHLDYRRAGGRLIASDGDATIVPEASSGLAGYGDLHVSAQHVDGEIANRRGDGSGGVLLVTGQGDRAATEAIHYDGSTVRSDARVVARGPGYEVESSGMVAQADGSAVRLTRGVRGKLQLEGGK